MIKDSIITCGLIAVMLALIFFGCASSGVNRNDAYIKIAGVPMETVVYAGIPTPNMLQLMKLVDTCLGLTEVGYYPFIVIVNTPFMCSNILADGCAFRENQLIVMYDSALIKSQGALLSHELVHQRIGLIENHPCGKISIQGWKM